MLLSLLIACAEPQPKPGADPDPGADPETGCNGRDDLCDRPLDAVAFAGTHNAMSSAEREWIYPNQAYAVPTQLAQGVRGLNLDLHAWEGGLWLCHGYCELGSQPLVEGLAEIAAFLADNPREVLVVTLEAYTATDETMAAFEASGLARYAYAHALGDPWPTLGALIDADQRAAVFTSAGGGAGWYHDQWTHWIDTPYSAQEVSEFSCAEDRGDPATATLFNVNRFLTAPFASPDLAAQANASPDLEDHVRRCWAETGRFPNQVLVDFYDIGDVLAVVDALNDDGG